MPIEFQIRVGSVLNPWLFFFGFRISDFSIHGKYSSAGGSAANQANGSNGVRDLLEVHEWAAPSEVNRLLNRAKVNVLWSRREGVNRAIIEGMLAGTPCLVREGLNYGYRYPHINSQTGRFSTDRDLSHNLFEMIGNQRQYTPRDWVLANMSCLRTTQLLNGAIKTKSRELGEDWTFNIVAKVNELGCVRYWNAEDEKRFRRDFEFLRACILSKPIA